MKGVGGTAIAGPLRTLLKALLAAVAVRLGFSLFQISATNEGCLSYLMVLKTTNYSVGLFVSVVEILLILEGWHLSGLL